MGQLTGSSSPIKSIQRGTAAGAGTVTITAVDMNKAVVESVSKGSAGTVATNSLTTYWYPNGTSSPAANIGLTGTAAASGGTTNLTSKGFSAVLTSSTQITVDGACEWQVIEYN